MTIKVISPRLQRTSDALLCRAGQLVDDDAFHIVAVSDFLSSGTRDNWLQVAAIWEDRGFGRVIVEGDQYGERSLWSFSDGGLAETKRLAKLHRQKSWLAWLKRNALAIVGVSAAVIAGIATSISAYIDYLELK